MISIDNFFERRCPMEISLIEVEKVNSITIWGLGTMGRTWAVTALLGGFRVHAHEPEEKTATSALEFIRNTLEKIESKKGTEGLAAEALDRFCVVNHKKAIFSGSSIHLEVIPEDMEMKKMFFTHLGPRLPDNTVLWSNTSCLDVEEMARTSGKPELFVGTHGMNPVHLMPGVEVVRTNLVDPTVYQWTMDVLKKMGKTPFPARNVPGFIVNKLYVALPWTPSASFSVRRQTLKQSIRHSNSASAIPRAACSWQTG